MIAVSRVGSGVRLIKPAKHFKHNEDGRTALGVWSNGSVPLIHSGNVVTRIGIHTHLKGCMINRILHSWLFHMKFMKLTIG